MGTMRQERIEWLRRAVKPWLILETKTEEPNLFVFKRAEKPSHTFIGVEQLHHAEWFAIYFIAGRRWHTYNVEYGKLPKYKVRKRADGARAVTVRCPKVYRKGKEEK